MSYEEYAPNGITLNVAGKEIPLQFNAPLAWKQTRGIDPWMMNIALQDETAYPGFLLSDGMPAKFRFDTPDQNGKPVSLEWEGWYLVRIEQSRSERDVQVATFADERWKAMYRRITASYNVQWPDGTWRADSLDGGKPWTCLRAIGDMCRKFGMDFYEFNKMPQEMRDLQMPANMGNSPAGGFVEASMAECMPNLLEYMGGALIMWFNGAMRVVPKTGDDANTIATLQAMPRMQDTASQSGREFEQPREMELAFEVMAEAAIERFDPDDKGTASGGGIDMKLVNVMQSWLYGSRGYEFGQITNDRVADDVYNAISEEYRLEGYKSEGVEEFIANNYFLPNILPLLRRDALGDFIDTKAETDKKLWFDSETRDAWRRMYAIDFPFKGAGNEAYRILSGLRLGRLSPDGSTRDHGNVFCDWCMMSDDILNPQDDPMKWEYSENVEFDGSRASPFKSSFVAEGKTGKLLLRIEPPSTLRFDMKRIFLGLFDEQLHYGNWQDVSAEGDIEIDGAHAKFDPSYKLRIIVTGRLTGDPTNVRGGAFVPNLEGRVYKLRRPLYPAGGIKSIQLRSYTRTANFAYAKEQMVDACPAMYNQFPTELLNADELEKIADDTAKRVKALFASAQAGGIVTPGIEAPMKGLGTGGDVKEFSIMLGNPKLHSISSQYIVVPDMPNVEVDQRSLDGEPVSAIDWS